MSTYHLTIFRQSRVLLLLFLLPVVFAGIMVIGAKTNLLAAILALLAFGFLAYYITVGHLVAEIHEGILFFTWTPKLLFNFREVDPVPLNTIDTIVLDKGRFLRKLKTADRSILINTTKVQAKDAPKFIWRLQQETKPNGTRIIDSWGEWKDKGRLNKVYQLTVALLTIAAIGYIYVLATKGFSIRTLAVLSSMSALFYFVKEMRDRM